MAWSAPEKQFTLFLDDVRLPADALVGDEDGGLWQLFAGLNPERIMGAALSLRHRRATRIDKTVEYAKTRSVWKDQPIGAHQGIQHPIAKVKIELEQARLLWQKAAALYDAGDDFTAGEYANMAKYAGGEVSCNAARRRRAHPRRQRAHRRVRPRQHAGRLPPRPDRPCQPGDDPQLRRHAHAGAAQGY